MNKSSSFGNSQKERTSFEIASSDEHTDKIKCFNAISLISYMVVVFFVAIAFVNPFEQILVGGLLLVIGYIIYLVVIPVTTISLFRQVGQVKKTTILKFALTALVYFLGIGGIILDIWLSKLHPRRIWLLFPTIAVFWVMVNIIVFLHSRRTKSWISLITFLMLLSASLIMIAPISLNATLSYVYLPPVITSDSLTVYKTCIEFLEKHDKYKNFKLDVNNWVSLGEDFAGGPEKYFSKSEIDKIMKLREKLATIKCQRFQRENNMVLFYKNANYILPVGLGVIYSFNGENPNEIDSQVLNPAKPFTKIADNWYMSKNLMLKGSIPRVDVPTSAPTALIDHSLRIEGLDLSVGVGKKLGIETKG